MSDNDQAAVEALMRVRCLPICKAYSHGDLAIPYKEGAEAILDAIRAGNVPIPGMVTEAVWRAAEAEVERLRDALDDERSQHRKDVKTLTEGQNLTDRMRREAIADGERRMREGDEALAKLRAEVEGLTKACNEMEARADHNAEVALAANVQRDRLAGLLREAVGPVPQHGYLDLTERMVAALAEVGKP